MGGWGGWGWEGGAGVTIKYSNKSSAHLDASIPESGDGLGNLVLQLVLHSCDAQQGQPLLHLLVGLLQLSHTNLIPIKPCHLTADQLSLSRSPHGKNGSHCQTQIRQR